MFMFSGLFEMNRKPKAHDELATAILTFRKTFLTVGAFSFFINLLMLSPSLYMMQVYDRVLGSRNETTLLVLTGLMLGVYILMNLLDMIRTFVLVRVGAKLDINLNQRVFTAAFERNLIRPGSNPAQALHDLNSVRQTVTGSALLALFDVPWIPIYLFVIFIFAPGLGWFSVVSSLILFALALANEKTTKPLLDEAQKLSMSSSTMAANNLRNAEVIEAMGMLPQISKRWFDVHSKYLQLQAKASDRAGMMAGATKFVRISVQSLILGYGALLVLEGSMTSGMMIASSILVGRALAPVESLIGNWKQFISGRAAYERLRLMLEAHPARKMGMPLPKPKGNIVVENVSAGAPGSREMILRGVSFAIAAGEVVAVIGASASGKSTLARLLVGIWGAQSGSVRLDGANVYDWNKDDLGPALGYLPQDIELFTGTIAENIARFGKMDSEKVIEAAQRAGMHELILRFPQGYDTMLMDGATSLSGGQRQRIGLARALYDDPSVIVLDEPNSNLDELGEQALAATIRDLKARGKTVVLITHRLSALAVVDKIMLLHEGQLKAYGPRDQVLAALSGARQTAAAPQAPQNQAALAPSSSTVANI